MSADEPNDPGATAYGLFLLADNFLDAARSVESSRQYNSGPTRLLGLHACELYFKAFLRKQGLSHQHFRDLMHNLAEIGRQAKEHGLDIDRQLSNELAKVTELDAYVNARYYAGSDRGEFSSGEATIRLAERVRELVRPAVDT